MRINKKGFTLVELLAVIAILGIILVIAVPKINNYIDSNKKNTFIVNARNIIRQIEYDNIDFKTFSKIPLNDLDLKEFLNEDIDLGNSVVYSLDDKIYLDLAGTNQYKDLYLCGISNTNKKVDVQETPCEEHNLIYIDFTVDLDGGSTNQNFNTKYISGNYLVLQVPIKTNGTFLGWELVSGNSTLDQNRIKFGTESTKIKAIWGNNPDLVVNLNGGTSNQKFDSKYSGGSLIVLQEPTREGYKFTGWKLVTGNAILSGNVLTTGTTNTVIEATWELNEFSITYELNGGTKGENAPTKGIVGDSLIISNPTKLGYTFKGWDVIGTGSSISGTILTIGSQDVILVANWGIDNYLISYNLNGGNATGNPSNYTIETSTFTLNNPAKTGYTFTGWTGSNGSTANTSVSVPKGSTGDKTYTANYTINTYTINYVLGGGASGSSAPTSGTYGSTVTVSNPTRTGYTFNGWSVSGTGAVLSGTNLTIGSSDVTLVANWIQNRVPTLNSSLPSNVSITVGSSTTLYASVTDTGYPANVSYQWYANGAAIAGATSSSYTYSNYNQGIGTIYFYCVVTNSTGSVTTRTATVTVNAEYIFLNGTFYNGGSYNWFGNSDTFQECNVSNVWHIGIDGSGHFGSTWTTNPVDVTGKTKLIFTVTATDTTGSNSSGNGVGFAHLGVTNSANLGNTAMVRYTSFQTFDNFNTREYTVNISDITGAYYVKIVIDRTNTQYDQDHIYVSGIRFE